MGRFRRATHAIGMATTGGDGLHHRHRRAHAGRRPRLADARPWPGLRPAGQRRLVTADGKQRHLPRARNPDLYWAVRGGGGNFGVATTFTYSLHPVDVVLGGLLMYPLERAAEVLRHYHQYCRTPPTTSRPRPRSPRPRTSPPSPSRCAVARSSRSPCAPSARPTRSRRHCAAPALRSTDARSHRPDPLPGAAIVARRRLPAPCANYWKAAT